ncbi:MAG: recombinase family protein [Candidatus Saccharimonas sp.]
MAGEFSKIHSGKVYNGSARVSEQGYSAGGIAPFGYVRVLLDEQRNRIGVLKHGEHKMISNQRVMFEPDESVRYVIERIYYEFVTLNRRQLDIANGLNDDNILTAKGKLWTSTGVTKLLSNETYAGTRIYNKTWARLHKKKRRNTPDEWVRCENAHTAIISMDMFNKAQERLYWLGRTRRHEGDRLIAKAKLYMRKYLQLITSEMPDGPWDMFTHRFLPISYGIESRGRTIFHINSIHSQYGKVLLCVLSSKEESVIKRTYAVDAAEITNSSFIVIEDNTKRDALTRDELCKNVTGLLLSMYERLSGTPYNFEFTASLTTN